MAEQLYYELCDMDINDYSENYQSDIAFINQVITLYGLENARQILNAYFD